MLVLTARRFETLMHSKIKGAGVYSTDLLYDERSQLSI